MPYILTGFTHDIGFRVFAFDLVEHGVMRTEYKVRADLTLARRYGITLQELPLLCLGLLERSDKSEEQHMITYTEADMTLHNDAKEQAAALKKRSPRRPTPSEGDKRPARSAHAL